MELELTVVDAFTTKAFAGNPAAVALIDSYPDAARMQDIAREMNLSETAFVVGRGDGDYDLRWFSPTMEVDLCGHATLATAHVLGGAATFHTRSGRLTCSPNSDGRIEMDFPADVAVSIPAPLAIAGACWFGTGARDVLVELEHPDLIRQFTPDLGALGALDTRGVIITAQGDRPEIDCVSRVFAPRAGIAEDPVTGSADCTLAAFWGDRLGKDSLVGEQASARGGMVYMDRRPDRVVIGGYAVTTAQVRVLA